MKRFCCLISLFVFEFLIVGFQNAIAQNNWTFPMIFTDGSGVTDTVWFIQDETATIGIDEHLGEGLYEIDTSTFQVYFMLNCYTTPSKVLALPFTTDFDGEVVVATKWDFPITVSWDETLFDTVIGDYPPIKYATLENSYSAEHDLEGHLIWDWYGWYIMGINTTGPQPPYEENDLENWDWFYAFYAPDFFPMAVTLMRYYTHIDENNDKALHPEVSPNPAYNIVDISFSTDKQQSVNISLYDMSGKKIKVLQNCILPSGNHHVSCDITDVATGCYIIKISNNDFSYVKLIKM